MDIKEVTFDEDDKNLFIIDDLKLKADAIRYSIIPKLELLINYSIAEIRSIYGHNPLNTSSIVKSPNFRAKRTTDFKMNYDWAIAGLSGQRKEELWKGISRHDKKEITVLPFKIQFELTTDGLALTLLCTSERFRLSDYKKFLEFHVRYEREIDILCHESQTNFVRKYFCEDLTPFTPLKDYLTILEDENIFEVGIVSQTIKYPITELDIQQFILSFITLYPIYDSYIQISLGEDIRFKELVKTLETWLFNYFQTDRAAKPTLTGEVNIERAKELADTKVKVMPALRWQVFQRDNWKCVACGRIPDDKII